MVDFVTLKNDICKRCQDLPIYYTLYERLTHSQTREDILQIVKDHMFDILRKRLLTTAWIQENFSTEMLYKLHILTSGRHDFVVRENICIIALGDSEVIVKTYNRPSVVILTGDHSSATVSVLGSSHVEMCAFGYSSADVIAQDNSTLTLVTHDTSRSKLSVYGNSTASVYEEGRSFISCKIGGGFLPVIRHLRKRRFLMTKWQIADVEGC